MEIKKNHVICELLFYNILSLLFSKCDISESTRVVRKVRGHPLYN